jgi:hypothetical protein
MCLIRASNDAMSASTKRKPQRLDSMKSSHAWVLHLMRSISCSRLRILRCQIPSPSQVSHTCVAELLLEAVCLPVDEQDVPQVIVIF